MIFQKGTMSDKISIVIFFLLIFHSSSEKKENFRCGISKAPVLLRIFGGHQTLVGKWPWMTSFWNVGFICGATLIDSRHVLTAAHCVQTVKPGFFVKIGSRELDYDDPKTYEKIRVTKINAHPDFTLHTAIYDLAVLTLERPSSMMPVCLPQPDIVQGAEKATAIGWGDFSEGGIRPLSLHEVQVPIWTKRNCSTYLTIFKKSLKLAERVICAGELGRDICQGDSGGPLMIEKNGVWTQVGVSSFFLTTCGDPPSMYAKLDHPEIYQWIKNATKEND